MCSNVDWLIESLVLCMIAKQEQLKPDEHEKTEKVPNMQLWYLLVFTLLLVDFKNSFTAEISKKFATLLI